MNQDAHPLAVTRTNLIELLGKPGEFFLIPYYQRKYAWDQRNCEVLLSDLLNVTTQHEARFTHFFSNVTLSPLDGAGRFYVVDGQQRVTTFSLFLEALRQALGEYADQLNDCLKNGIFLKLSFEDPTDQRTYRHLLLGHFCDEESLSVNMVKNFRYFREQISDEREKWRAFLDGGTLRRLLFVKVVLPSRMPPQRVFERMNSTKLPINEFDLIKNYLLMATKDEEDERKVYEQMERVPAYNRWHWCWRVANLLSMHCRKPIADDAIYEPFRKFFADGPIKAGSVAQFLDVLTGWFETYDQAADVFEKLGLHGIWTRVHHPSGFGPLLMKLAVVFPTGDDRARRNRLIACIVENHRDWIARDRLLEPKLHRTSWDTERVFKFLKTPGAGHEKDALEIAVLRHWAVGASERADAAIRNWVDEVRPEERHYRNSRIIGLADKPSGSADDVVRQFHQNFLEKKAELEIYPV